MTKTLSSKPLLMANWKMNLLPHEAIDLVTKLIKLPLSLDTNLVFAPPYPYLALIEPVLKDYANICLGAQDLSVHHIGAYTGEVAGKMLKAVGVKYVLVGHSERREYHKETNVLLENKLLRAWEEQLIPVLCVGETSELRAEGQYLEYIRGQIHSVLPTECLDKVGELVIAYEPIWAIGTGKTASPAEVQEVHAYIRQVLAEFKLENTSILYGGSVKPENADDLFAMADVDGALVGGASLQLDPMQAIIQRFVKAFSKE